MDQPRRAQLHLPAAHHPAGRGLRRGHVLRAVLARAAAAGRGARLHRHRLHGGRREAAVRRSRGPDRAEGRAARQQRRRARRGPDLAREPVPGDVRDGAGGDGQHRRRGAARGLRRPRRGRGHRDDARRRRRARAGRPEGAAGRRPRAAAAAPRRPGRPDERRQLSRARRLRGPARRAGDGRAGRAARGHRRQAARARRRRVPDRPQVGGRGRPPDPPALPDLQRRRVRARDVQGPRAPRARPVLRHRVDDDRGLRHRLRARLPLPARRVPAGLGAPGRRRHRGAGPRLPRPGHLRPGHQLRHRAAQGRGGVHLRRGDGALQLDRGLSRRAAQQAAVPRRARAVRQADGDQQRRDARQRPRHRPRRRPGLRPHRHRGLDGHAPVLRLGPGRAAGAVRGAVRHHPPRGARHGRRRDRRPPAADHPPRRRRRPLRDARTSSTSRCPSRRPARPA